MLFRFNSATNSITVDSPPHSILPLRESIHSATIHLMQSFGWKRIAVISSQHPMFCGLNMYLPKECQRTRYSHGNVYRDISLSNRVFTKVATVYMAYQITVAFIPQSEAVDILCAAYFNGFKWPDYAWVFADISKPNIFNDYCQV